MSADKPDREAGRLVPLDPAAGVYETQRLCAMCVEMLPVDGAAVAVMGSAGSREMVHSTNSVSQQLDELQFVLGEGPCIDAFISGNPVLIADLADAASSNRWPGFAQEATEAGARAVFAFPLQAGTVSFGVLELYRGSPGALEAEDLAAGLLLAEAAVSIVLSDVTSELTRDQAGRAGESGRADIHRATGMIAAQLGVSISDAQSRLRAAAFADQRSLLATAREVLSRIRRFTDGEPQ